MRMRACVCVCAFVHVIETIGAVNSFQTRVLVFGRAADDQTCYCYLLVVIKNITSESANVFINTAVKGCSSCQACTLLPQVTSHRAPR